MSQTISSQLRAFCVLADYPVNLNDCLTALALPPLNLPHVDVYQTPVNEALKISAVREIKAFLNTPPLINNTKIVFIADANHATLEAQNALLKTIEEPPPNSLLFLIISQLDNLLPTISSRCQTLNLSRPPVITPLNTETINFLDSFSQQSPASRLIDLEPYLKDRLKSLNFLFDCLTYFRQKMHHQLTPATYFNLKLVTEIYSRILKNGQLKVCLGHLALNLHAVD